MHPTHRPTPADADVVACRDCGIEATDSQILAPCWEGLEIIAEEDRAALDAADERGAEWAWPDVWERIEGHFDTQLRDYERKRDEDRRLPW